MVASNPVALAPACTRSRRDANGRLIAPREVVDETGDPPVRVAFELDDRVSDGDEEPVRSLGKHRQRNRISWERVHQAVGGRRDDDGPARREFIGSGKARKLYGIDGDAPPSGWVRGIGGLDLHLR